MSRRVVVTRVAVLFAAVSIPAAFALASTERERAPVGQQVIAPAVVVPDGVGNVSRLTPPMARATARAIAAAERAGVPLRVTSGWRSWAQQERLYREAVVKYGTAASARRWVLPPGESAHVQGSAVDVGPAAGVAWLRVNGVRFGLCQRYANEPWHFERLAAAKGSRCPPLEPHP